MGSTLYFYFLIYSFMEVLYGFYKGWDHKVVKHKGRFNICSKKKKHKNCAFPKSWIINVLLFKFIFLNNMWNE